MMSSEGGKYSEHETAEGNEPGGTQGSPLGVAVARVRSADLQPWYEKRD